MFSRPRFETLPPDAIGTTYDLKKVYVTVPNTANPGTIIDSTLTKIILSIIYYFAIINLTLKLKLSISRTEFYQLMLFLI